MCPKVKRIFELSERRSQGTCRLLTSAKILEPAMDFTGYAIAYRYPDAQVQKDDLTEARLREAVKITDAIYHELRSRISIP